MGTEWGSRAVVGRERYLPHEKLPRERRSGAQKPPIRVPDRPDRRRTPPITVVLLTKIDFVAPLRSPTHQQPQANSTTTA